MSVFTNIKLQGIAVTINKGLIVLIAGCFVVSALINGVLTSSALKSGNHFST